MNHKKNTKRVLITSILSLALCMTMLIGTTFAWFTDSVSSAGNKIIAGTLDIALYKTEANIDGVLNGNPVIETEITNSTEPLFDKDIRWEPAYEAVANLKLENRGNLAIKWEVALRSTQEVGKLAEVIDVYTMQDEMIYEGNGRDYYADKLTLVGTLKDVLTGTAIFSGTMEKTGDIEFFTIVLKMQEGAGNEYQGQTAGVFDITVLATQHTYESDSFDYEYDKNASIDDAALAHGGIIKLENHVEKEVVVSKGATVDLDMNEKAINNTFTNKGKVTIKDGVINAEGDHAFYNEGNAEMNNVTLNMTNSTEYIVKSRTTDSVTVYDNVDVTSTGGGVNVWEGKVVFKSGSITTNSTSTSARHVFYAAKGAEIIIEDGDFVFSPTNLTRKGSYLCAQGEGASIVVKGGIFAKPSTRTAPIQAVDGATVTIYGGKFQFEPQAQFIADGYTAVKGTDGWWTVSAE